MVEECGKRFAKDERGVPQNEDERVQELLDLVNEVFPPSLPKSEDGVIADMKDI